MLEGSGWTLKEPPPLCLLRIWPVRFCSPFSKRRLHQRNLGGDPFQLLWSGRQVIVAFNASHKSGSMQLILTHLPHYRRTLQHSRISPPQRPHHDTRGHPGPPKSVSTTFWSGRSALALVGGNGSAPCPKTQMLQSIRLIPMI